MRRAWLGVMLALALTTAAAAEPKRVLLLHSFGPHFVPWVFFSAQFREQLVKQSPDQIDLYEASLEGSRFQNPEEQGPFVDYLRGLFADRRLDLVVTMGAPATFFVQRYRAQFFPETPMIIAASEQRAIDALRLTPNDASVGTTLDFEKWIQGILDVLPDTTHVAWAVGASPLERFWTEHFRRTSEVFKNRLTFEFFNDLSFQDMLKRVAALPPNSAIYYVDLRVDAEGLPLDRDRVLARLHQAANAPIFSYVDSYLGQGIVGGPMLSSAELGQRLASVAVRILGGEKAGDIKLQPLAMGAPAYDWRELKRWNISETRLPPGSRILFREPSASELYRLQILAILAALLLQAALISWLVYEHRRRQRAEVHSRQAMAELTYMNRRAAVGELSASIAHEVSQPLSGIATRASAALRWLQAEKPDLEKARAALEGIVNATHRVSDIVTSVRAMFKKETGARTAVNLNDLVNTVLALLRVDLQKQEIGVEVRLDEALPTISGSAVQLQQVLLNLILNAAEAMCDEPSRRLTIWSQRTVSGNVEVSVEDTGPGISESELARIFSPLFTTKSGGMGMGLSICRSIIEGHGGKIWASPGPKRGSIFRFELPTSADAAPTAHHDSAATDAR